MNFIDDHFFAIVACVLLIAAGLDALAKRLEAKRNELQKEVYEQRALAQKAAQQALREVADAWEASVQAQPSKNDGWFALPGGKRLEYKSTGFYIELRPESAKGPYALHTPENACIAGGNNLPGLKTMGRIAAAEREEFSTWGKDYLP